VHGPIEILVTGLGHPEGPDALPGGRMVLVTSCPDVARVLTEASMEGRRTLLAVRVGATNQIRGAIT